MIKYDSARARQAVQYLVDSSYFQHHMRKLRGTLGKPRSLPFREEAEVLNELLVIGRQSEEAFENLIRLAEFKRDSGKNSYQRDYMAAKRKRDRKVIALEEAMIGKKLSLDQRAAVLRRQYETWNRERDAMLDAVKDQSWADRNSAIRDFWERKESEIDQLQLEAANQPVVRRARRYRVEVAQKPTSMREAFKKAIDKRP